MYRAVLFDFGGVLATAPAQGVNRFEEMMGYEQNSLMTILFGSPEEPNNLYHQLECGEVEIGEYWIQCRQRAEVAGCPISDEVLFWECMDFGVNEEMLAVARGLRPHYITAVLSNNIRELAMNWRGLVEAEDSFDHVFDSSELGVRKPDPEIFLHACEAMAVRPDEAVFLDDLEINVRGAQSIGFAAIHVESIGAAIGELRHLLESQGNSGWPQNLSP